MAVPDMKHVVERVRDSRAWDFTTREEFWAYANACALAIHKKDPDFGELIKTQGQNHRIDPLGRRVAVDCVLYRPTGQAWDFIGSAGYGIDPETGKIHENPVSWGTNDPVGFYPPESWRVPYLPPLVIDEEIDEDDLPPATDVDEDITRDFQANVLAELLLIKTKVEENKAAIADLHTRVDTLAENAEKSVREGFQQLLPLLNRPGSIFDLFNPNRDVDKDEKE